MFTIEGLYHRFLQSSGISIDSRTVQRDQMFAAIRGERFDGHKFVDDVIELGASFCLVDRLEFADKPKCVWVPNVLAAMQRLAHHHRQHFQIPILALSGSNGKTTTKELISSVLTQKFKVLATHGNLNNHIGVPLTLLRLDQSHEIAVIEMGANHQGEIKWLCDIADPTHGLITNIGRAHLEGFGGIEGIRKGKCELYHYICGKGGQAFYNSHERSLEELPLKFPEIIAYGKSGFKNEVNWLQFSSDVNPIQFRLNGGKWHHSQLYGAYNKNNIITAVAMGSYFGLDAALIERGVSTYHPANNRSQRVHEGSNDFYLDAYNANPTSVLEAIHFFDQLKGQNKVLILGDMLELGSTAIEAHWEVLTAALSASGVREVFLVGKIFLSLDQNDPRVNAFPSVQELKQHLKQKPLMESQVLIKGSRMMQLEQVLEVPKS